MTEYQYDERGYLISVTEPNGNTVSYTYDDHGNRLSMTYPDGKTAKYTYDSMNRLVSVKGTDGKKTSYTYDLNGQRVSTNGAWENIEYTYDDVGNLVSQVTNGKYDVSLNKIDSVICFIMLLSGYRTVALSITELFFLLKDVL